MLIMWSQQKNQIGTIRCKRCNHVEPAKGQWGPFRGIRPVCTKCGSEVWITIEQREEVPERAEPRETQLEGLGHVEEVKTESEIAREREESRKAAIAQEREVARQEKLQAKRAAAARREKGS
jgi:DNA-directed RNA polymerase subunit RPC12/RpoP